MYLDLGLAENLKATLRPAGHEVDEPLGQLAFEHDAKRWQSMQETVR